MKHYQSWGRYPNLEQRGEVFSWRDNTLPVLETSLLPYGQGRSYGDCCLNDSGIVLDTSGLNRFIAFDPVRGSLRCEAGVTLDEILRLVIPHGWFLPVTPGTRFVSVGGAIANDVHGKNHHREGTFGCHVNSFELLRSDGQRLTCSEKENPGMFQATIAGLGLTGLITWAEIRLKPISSSSIEGESIRFSSLDEFFQLSADSDKDWEYTVSWIDCNAKGKQLGRGIFYRGNHAEQGELSVASLKKKMIHMPVDAPAKLLNHYTVSMFNNTMYQKHRAKRKPFVKDMIPFFYPLDRIGHWNRMYGKQGFLQFQCVVPMQSSVESLSEILQQIARAGTGSFLAVLKVFGDKTSPGIMSFPRKGATLALDFPYRGQETLSLFQELDKLVADAGGAIYPAKDACMQSSSYMKYYPRHDDFVAQLDPKFSSSFWRRVNGQ